MAVPCLGSPSHSFQLKSSINRPQTDVGIFYCPTVVREEASGRNPLSPEYYHPPHRTDTSFFPYLHIHVQIHIHIYIYTHIEIFSCVYIYIHRDRYMCTGNLKNESSQLMVTTGGALGSVSARIAFCYWVNKHVVCWGGGHWLLPP